MVEKLLSLSIPGTHTGNEPQTITAPGGIPTGGLDTDGNTIFQSSISIFIAVAVIICLFFLLWGGIQWTMSQGDKGKLQTARNRIIYAILGLVLIFISFFIVSIVGTLFGVDLLP